MKVLHLNERPNGFPNEDTFDVKEAARPELPKDGIIVQLLYISVDPTCEEDVQPKVVCSTV